MQKIKVFISSVQKEFAHEREMLYEYLSTDALLGRFFEPFIFERLPALDQSPSEMYLGKVAHCDIYIGLIGRHYGYEDTDGISPTEREYDHAVLHHKTRLIYLGNVDEKEIHPKEKAFIRKVEKSIVRKMFSSVTELKSCVYASLIHYLCENEIIRTGPFDATYNATATFDDLDLSKVAEFVRIAKLKRGFPLSVESTPEIILTHLNLMNAVRITNAAILLFGKQPQ